MNNYTQWIVPGFLIKLDHRLLLQQPTIWVTRIHYLLFFGLLLNVLLYSGGYFLYQPNLSNIPYSIGNSALIIMTLPAISIFALWFVIQARYNVDKNFGKISARQDFSNYLFYVLSICIIYLIPLMIPMGMTKKISASIDEQALYQSMKTYNAYHIYAEGVYNDQQQQVRYLPEKKMYEVKRSNSITAIDLLRNELYDYYRDYEYDLDMSALSPEHLAMIQTLQQKIEITPGVDYLNEKEIWHEIEEYNRLAQTYDNSSIISTSEYISLIRAGEHPFAQYNDIHWQLKRLYDYKTKNSGFWLWDNNHLRFMLAFCMTFALLVWLFKNVHWKNYLAAAVITIFIPLFVGIFAAILYGIFDLYGDQENLVIFVIILLVHSTAFYLGLKPYLEQRHSSVGVVSMVLFQLATPFLLAVYTSLADSHQHYRDHLITVYWIGIAYVLVTLPLYKKYYSQMWAFPHKR
jgi:hypothetical protein